jgi:hypothetical protein
VLLFAAHSGVVLRVLVQGFPQLEPGVEVNSLSIARVLALGLVGRARDEAAREEEVRLVRDGFVILIAETRHGNVCSLRSQVVYAGLHCHIVFYIVFSRGALVMAIEADSFGLLVVPRG